MIEPKISIVLSTYNRSGMLPRMLDSILDQDLEDFELLLINNGSTDSTHEVCRFYIKKDKRIRYFRIPVNNGPAAARNMGIKNAYSKFVSLVDDDDFCESNMLSHLYGLIEKYNADIAVTGCADEYENEICPKYVYDETYVWNRVEGLSEFLKRDYFHTAPATKLFRKSLFSNIEFISGVLIDDIHVVYKLFANANKVVAQGIPTYRFLKHGSNMTSFITADRLRKEILEEYLGMQKERVRYVSQKVPELSKQVRYAEMSYMISMIEKIKKGCAENCYDAFRYMTDKLRSNQCEFLESEWITEREKRLMKEYII